MDSADRCRPLLSVDERSLTNIKVEIFIKTDENYDYERQNQFDAELSCQHLDQSLRKPRM